MNEVADPLAALQLSDYDSDHENDDAEMSEEGMDKLEAFMSGAVNMKMVLNENRAFNAAPLMLAKKLSSANQAQMDQQKAHM